MPLITQKQVIEELVLLRSEIAAKRQKAGVLARLLRMENQLEALRARLEQEEPDPPHPTRTSKVVLVQMICRWPKPL